MSSTTLSRFSAILEANGPFRLAHASTYSDERGTHVTLDLLCREGARWAAVRLTCAACEGIVVPQPYTLAFVPTVTSERFGHSFMSRLYVTAPQGLQIAAGFLELSARSGTVLLATVSPEIFGSPET